MDCLTHHGSKENTCPSPFLKWAGGKRWLVQNHRYLFETSYERYIEPFLGSAAVFFYMQPKRAILSDRNECLIDTYRSIKDDWESLYSRLVQHHAHHSKEYYYQIRSKEYEQKVDQAAQFIYLNRTCWNGLYRVNQSGRFNVPIGTKSSVILPTDDFESISTVLSGVDLLATDFETTISNAGKNDFLFVDPPYTVKHNNNGFVKYNQTLFSWDDQIRLCESLVDAKNRGAKIVVTNADHESIRKLYKKDFKIAKVERLSIISGKSEARGRVSELVITG